MLTDTDFRAFDNAVTCSNKIAEKGYLNFLERGGNRQGERASVNCKRKLKAKLNKQFANVGKGNEIAVILSQSAGDGAKHIEGFMSIESYMKAYIEHPYGGNPFPYAIADARMQAIPQSRTVLGEQLEALRFKKHVIDENSRVYRELFATVIDNARSSYQKTDGCVQVSLADQPGASLDQESYKIKAYQAIEQRIKDDTGMRVVFNGQPGGIKDSCAAAFRAAIQTQARRIKTQLYSRFYAERQANKKTKVRCKQARDGFFSPAKKRQVSSVLVGSSRKPQAATDTSASSPALR